MMNGCNAISQVCKMTFNPRPFGNNNSLHPSFVGSDTVDAKTPVVSNINIKSATTPSMAVWEISWKLLSMPRAFSILSSAIIREGHEPGHHQERALGASPES